MTSRIIASTVIILGLYSAAPALEPNQILVIANAEIKQSVKIAEHYCGRRATPPENVLALPLGSTINDTISRQDYESRLAEPLRRKLLSPEFAGKIRCLLTIYGVPYKVAGRGRLPGREEELARLKELLEQESARQKRSGQIARSGDGNNSTEQQESTKRSIARLQSEIDYIIGNETAASVDCELSMVLQEPYELYRWQLNCLKKDARCPEADTLMVSRLDGPDPGTAERLVDKSIKAEEKGLKGVAYIDSRGISDDGQPYSPGHFDQSLRDLAVLIRFRTTLTVKEERTEKLFEPGTCPETAIYCGWYSLRKYIDAFDFVDGAVGFHIASLEATGLHDPNSTSWCPAMLKHGITATLGAVAEPYLHAFPEPKEFFLELFEGRCLVEAYYRTKPFNSWQLVLFGDPLYRPFKASGSKK
jgi:uncharacterized protein (TIGR03790 family)